MDRQTAEIKSIMWLPTCRHNFISSVKPMTVSKAHTTLPVIVQRQCPSSFAWPTMSADTVSRQGGPTSNTSPACWPAMPYFWLVLADNVSCVLAPVPHCPKRRLTLSNVGRQWWVVWCSHNLAWMNERMNEWIWFKWRCHRNCCRGTVLKLSSKMVLNVSNEMMQQTGQVFRCRQKDASDDTDRTLGNKEFQAWTRSQMCYLSNIPSKTDFLEIYNDGQSVDTTMDSSLHCNRYRCFNSQDTKFCPFIFFSGQYQSIYIARCYEIKQNERLHYDSWKIILDLRQKYTFVTTKKKQS